MATSRLADKDQALLGSGGEFTSTDDVSTDTPARGSTNAAAGIEEVKSNDSLERKLLATSLANEEARLKLGGVISASTLTPSLAACREVAAHSHVISRTRSYGLISE